MINVENYRATRQAADPHGHAVVTGLVGAAILAVGVFAPLVNVPLLGSVNYIAGDYGKYLLATAVVAALVALLRQHWLAALVGLGALGFVAWNFTVMQVDAAERNRKLATAKSSPAG